VIKQRTELGIFKDDRTDTPSLEFPGIMHHRRMYTCSGMLHRDI